MQSGKLGKDNKWFYENLAECYEKLKDYEKAYINYKIAKTKESSDSSLDTKLRKLAKKLDKIQETETFIKSFMSENSENKN